MFIEQMLKSWIPRVKEDSGVGQRKIKKKCQKHNDEEETDYWSGRTLQVNVLTTDDDTHFSM